jgi:hypothetical protein
MDPTITTYVTDETVGVTAVTRSLNLTNLVRRDATVSRPHLKQSACMCKRSLTWRPKLAAKNRRLWMCSRSRSHAMTSSPILSVCQDLVAISSAPVYESFNFPPKNKKWVTEFMCSPGRSDGERVMGELTSILSTCRFVPPPPNRRPMCIDNNISYLELNSRRATFYYIAVCCYAALSRTRRI